MSLAEVGRSNPVGRVIKTPVAVWATLGAVFVGLQIYLYTRWLLSGPVPTPRGDTPVPTWMTVAVWAHIAVGVPLAIVMVYHTVVRPWRAERRLSNDALLMLACLSMFWQDLLMNYLHFTVVYTTAWPNLGSWYGFLPGFQPPHGNLLASAAMFFFPMYVVVLYGFTSLAVPVLRAVQRRWPKTSKPAMFAVAFVLALIANLTLEAGWARLGLYVFASAIKPLTLFAGHYYQYPLYHAVIWAAAWAGLTYLRFYKDDTGLTFAERGIDKFGLAGARRTLVRFLALAGVANAMFLAYNLTDGLFNAHSGSWIEDVNTKSYYTNGLCEPANAGPQTVYVCPQPHTR